MAGNVGNANITITPVLVGGFGASVKSKVVAETESAGIGTQLSNSIGGQFKGAFSSALSGGDGVSGGITNAFSGAASSIASAAGASGAAAGGLFVLAIELSILSKVAELAIALQGVFDQAMASTGQLVGAGAKLVQDEVTAVANVYHASFEDAGTAITIVTQRLHENYNATVSVAGAVIELAQLTGTNLTTAATEAAKAFQQWKIPAQQQVSDLDMVYTAFQKTGVPVNELLTDLAQYGPTLQGLGYSFQDATQIITQLDATGQDVGRTLTGMRRGYAELVQATTGQQSADEDLIAAENALADAQRAVADAQANVTDSATALTAARQKLADLENGGADLQRQAALISEAQGVQSVAEARERQVSAEQALTELESGGLAAEKAQAQANIADATNQLADASERALKAQQTLAALLAGPSAEDQAKAQLSITEAQNALTKATTDRAAAERELKDANSLGDQNLITDASQKLADATANQTKAQLDLTDAQKAQTDLQPGSAAAQQKLNDAQQAAKEAAQAVTDAQLAQNKARQDAINQLGADLSGANQIRDAQNTVRDATLAAQQAQVALLTARATDRANLGANLSGATLITNAQAAVAKATLTAQDATGKLKDAQEKLAQTDDPVKGMAAIKKILDDAGLSSASTKDQWSYLMDYLGDPTKSVLDKTNLAIDLFGTKVGTDMAAAIASGALSIDGGPGSLHDALTKSQGDLDLTWNSIDKVQHAWQDLVNEIKTDLLPTIPYIVAGLQAVVGILADVVKGIESVKNAATGSGSTLSKVVGSVISPVAGIAGVIGGFFADGTDDAPGGLAVYGEHGPEIGYVPRHTVIMNHDESVNAVRSAVAGQGAGGGMSKNYTLNNFAPPVRQLDEGEFARQMNRLQAGSDF